METTNTPGIEITSSQMMITRANSIPSPEAELAEYEEVSIEEIPQQEPPHFIEGNSEPITLENLKTQCVVPTYADNTLTISHQDFVQSIILAAQDAFPNESIGEPEIRVSHAQHGRIPSALHKKASELLPSDRTLYYQRMCFMVTISMKDIINNRETHIVVGGVRALNNENLGTKHHPEIVKCFIGTRVTVCSNLCIFGNCLIDKLEVMSAIDIYDRALSLFRGFDRETNCHMLESLSQTRLSVEDFTHVLGRMRLYEALSPTQRKVLDLPPILLGDSILNQAAKNFVCNPNFGIGNAGSIDAWQFLNILNEAAKSSYIDKFLQRMVNCTDIAFGIAAAIRGEDSKYSWFIQ